MTGGYNWREVQELKDALAAANRRLQERDRQDVLASAAAREAETKAREAAQRAADQQTRDAEIEGTRKAAWLAHFTTDEGEYQQLEANAFSPVYVVNHTPLEGWPPGDGPENHSYSAVAPPVESEDDGFVPPLVLKARQMGLDV
jgi:hypothetical protein